MTKPLPSARLKAGFFTALALAVGGFVAGCDTQENADLERGKTLFVQECGVCHALTEARQVANIGPNLDSAFAEARSNGMDQDTIEGVVEYQIANPRPAEPDNTAEYMAANIVEGKDAKDVAAYVASVAGVEGIQAPELGDGQQIFADLCSGCHQLAAAGSAGGVGPSLDEVLPGQSAEEITISIQNPEDMISAGFDAGIMPVFDENTVPEEDLDELVQYLIDNIDGAGAPSGGGSSGSAAGE